MARHRDDALHAEDIRGDLHGLDQRELLLDLRLDDAGHPGGKAHAGAFARETAERLIGRLPRERRRVELGRERVAQLLQREAAGIGDDARARERLGHRAEEGAHRLGRLEVGLGVRRKRATGFIERRSFADAVEDVQDGLVLRHGVEDTVGGDDGDAEPLRRGAGVSRAREIFSVERRVLRDAGTLTEGLANLGDALRRGVGVDQRPQTSSVLADELQREPGVEVLRQLERWIERLALAMARPALGEDAA